MKEQQFLFITVILVGLIGAPAVYSVVKEPTHIKANQYKTVPGTVSPGSHRYPANIEKAQESGRKSIKSKSVVVEYPCNNSNKVFEVDGTLLRLKGGSCISQKWQNVSIINQANGFTGSVIFLKDNQFTTDFIDLNEGNNRIEIQATTEKGQAVTQILTIKRRMPAAVSVEE